MVDQQGVQDPGPGPQQEPAASGRSVAPIAIAAVVVLVLLGGAVWWFALRDDSPEKLSVADVTTSAAGDDGTATTVGESPEALDGGWAIAPGSDSTAGFRISESFASGLADHEAVGRSTAVVGGIEVAGSQVTEASFTVDLTALEFTDDPGIPVANRVNALQDRGLEISQFPEATFELTEPIDFGEAPEEGTTLDATATGELTLHGVTNEISFPVQAILRGNTIAIGTNPDDLPEISLADYDIEAPTGGPIASVEDTGTFEFLVIVTQQ